MKKSGIIILAVVVLAVAFIGYQNTYQAKFAKRMYLNEQYTKSDNAYLDTNMLGDLIAFGENEILIVEIRDLEAMRQEIKTKGGADIVQNGAYDTITLEYQNPKYNPLTKEITADDLQESIKFVGKNQVEYKGKVFAIQKPNNPTAKLTKE